ncbi:CLUMA_CG011255, isoform A [Clunio marinus]|uniref:CLUMA_CG011255, isoform A n=1 Tax=Clunio marinus TaxID=568069 RepID=A0A1J1ICC5_9DIPT|nr:CLUMA_CG011255, isoform A [Clunio marinus]
MYRSDVDYCDRWSRENFQGSLHWEMFSFKDSKEKEFLKKFQLYGDVRQVDDSQSYHVLNISENTVSLKIIVKKVNLVTKNLGRKS